jgi:hypothetical protein
MRRSNGPALSHRGQPPPHAHAALRCRIGTFTAESGWMNGSEREKNLARPFCCLLPGAPTDIDFHVAILIDTAGARRCGVELRPLPTVARTRSSRSAEPGR